MQRIWKKELPYIIIRSFGFFDHFQSPIHVVMFPLSGGCIFQIISFDLQFSRFVPFAVNAVLSVYFEISLLSSFPIWKVQRHFTMKHIAVIIAHLFDFAQTIIIRPFSMFLRRFTEIIHIEFSTRLNLKLIEIPIRAFHFGEVLFLNCLCIRSTNNCDQQKAQKILYHEHYFKL